MKKNYIIAGLLLVLLALGPSLWLGHLIRTQTIDFLQNWHPRGIVVDWDYSTGIFHSQLTVRLKPKGKRFAEKIVTVKNNISHGPFVSVPDNNTHHWQAGLAAIQTDISWQGRVIQKARSYVDFNQQMKTWFLQPGLTGFLTVNGTEKNYRLTVQADQLAPELGPLHLQAKGQIFPEDFSLDQFILDNDSLRFFDDTGAEKLLFQGNHLAFDKTWQNNLGQAKLSLKTTQVHSAKTQLGLLQADFILDNIDKQFFDKAWQVAIEVGDLSRWSVIAQQAEQLLLSLPKASLALSLTTDEGILHLNGKAQANSEFSKVAKAFYLVTPKLFLWRLINADLTVSVPEPLYNLFTLETADSPYLTLLRLQLQRHGAIKYEQASWRSALQLENGRALINNKALVPMIISIMASFVSD